jgi:argininosuccinate lyase
MRAFNDSITFDVRLWEADLRGSEAYAGALAKAGLITQAEAGQLKDGLQQIRREFEDGHFKIEPSDEDIHTAVERRLGELAGEVAGKLHTGRSRNDQVATDTRLWLRNEIGDLRAYLVACLANLVDQAQTQLDVILPGYTHLQQAQPIRFSHWLLNYAWKLDRDVTRLDQVAAQVNVLPLGSGALAGNPLGIDRQFLADDLGFATLSANSLDAVADRDYIAEFISWAAISQTHLSSLAEDLIIYSSNEFGFVELDDAYSTGSSLMPQKKNPDSLELIRGKTGRIIGNLTGFLATLKGLPSTYNKDLQEDKETLFDTVDTMAMTLQVMAGVVDTLTVNGDRMAQAMNSHLLATELADYLVSKGMPFRQAHEVVGRVVQLSLSIDQSLWSMPLQVYQSISPLFERDVHERLDFEKAVERYNSIGGSGLAPVLAQIEALQERYDL